VSRSIETAWTLTTGPALSVVELDDIKAHARITDNTSDALLDRYIASATEEAELYLGRGLLTQTWTLQLSDFADVLPLPMAAPLQNDSQADPSTAPVITYYDTDGTLQTLATTVYDVDIGTRPGQITLTDGQSWPSLQSGRLTARVFIVYVVGWTSAESVPERIKQGIRQFVTYLDLDRDGMEIRALEARMAAERCWSDRVTWTPPRCGW
jgi:uncharacterized phiE125 gp8 family phage protein